MCQLVYIPRNNRLVGLYILEWLLFKLLLTKATEICVYPLCTGSITLAHACPPGGSQPCMAMQADDAHLEGCLPSIRGRVWLWGHCALLEVAITVLRVEGLAFTP